MSVTINYQAEATPAKFHASKAFVRSLMGPIGSGKSVACCLEMFAKACAQEPFDGVRSSRWAAIRNTYPELKSTTIKTFEDWFPIEICQINWAPPITGKLKLDLPDGTRVEMEIMFLALDKPNDVKKLLSLELTGCWLNEVREIPKQILDGATGRVGRYPAKRRGGPTWSGIIMDTNPPDDDHWLYTLAEEKKPEGYDFFKQPPALIELEGGKGYVPNPAAENVVNQPLGYQYWLRQVSGKDRDWINVYVLGLYGSIHDGKPVYGEFNDDIHTAKETLETYNGLPLYIGWDYGLTPACVAGQLSPHGQLRIIHEWTSEDMGIREFARDVVMPDLQNTFSGLRIISVGDPAGNQRSQTEQKSCMDILAEEGIATEQAPTNEVIARLDSVRFYMKAMDREGNPGFIIDPDNCKTLRRGFNGGYKYERVQITGEERFKDQPAKNKFSHPHDALQYLCTRLRHGLKVVRAQPRQRRRRTAAGWT